MNSKVNERVCTFNYIVQLLFLVRCTTLAVNVLYTRKQNSSSIIIFQIYPALKYFRVQTICAHLFFNLKDNIILKKEMNKIMVCLNNIIQTYHYFIETL